MAKRKMTAKSLEQSVEAYFKSIRSERPLLKKMPDLREDADGVFYPRMDAYGHEMYRYEPVVAADGKPAMEVVWLEPPSVIGLSLYLGVDRTTLFRWRNLRETKTKEGQQLTSEEEKICNILTRAWGRIEAYLIAQTENPKAARGATANLEANFGWKRRKEVGFDEQTTDAIQKSAVLSMEERLALLKEMGLKLPGMGDAEEQEGQDED